MKVTIATMIDQLVTVNAKIFRLEDIKRAACATDEGIAAATKKTNELNVQRNTLIDSIDKAFNKIAKGKKQKLFNSNKMYGK